MAASSEDGSVTPLAEELEIIDLDELDGEDETWLVNPTSSAKASNYQTEWTLDMSTEETRLPKRSLVEKLDMIAKGSPTRFTASSVLMSPSYSSRPRESSTPMSKNPLRSHFDPRTFTRPSPSRGSGSTGDSSSYYDAISSSSPIKLNLTYDQRPRESCSPFNATFDKVLNSTYQKEDSLRNATFDIGGDATYTRKLSDDRSSVSSGRLLQSNHRLSRDSSHDALEEDRLSTASDGSASHKLNDVGDVQQIARMQEESLRHPNRANATFDKKDMSTHLNTTYQKEASPGGKHNATFDVQCQSGDNKANNSRRLSHDQLEDDRLSTTSDSSMSHRLNDVGDVQHLARMQEESLRQAVMSNNHRSATVSPSSENSPHSPSTEGYSGGGQPDFQSEEGSCGHPERQGYQQYSSQDSLPDSPYSSQSLDSQPPQGIDRLGRSMPNLNKIRGQNRPGGLPAASAAGAQRQTNYGLSRQHQSDPRLQAGRMGPPQSRYQQPGVPSRGAVVTREGVSSSSGIRYPAARFSNISLRPPSVVATNKPGGATRIARPAGTGIPRPGSRLPGPTRSGIPKPGGSQPGSRASSVGPRKTSVDWMANCY